MEKTFSNEYPPSGTEGHIHVNHTAHSDDSEEVPSHKENYNTSGHDLEESDPDNHVGETLEVKRGLKMRHISMISLGGTIGTGLFIGTGGALQQAGPCGALIAYVFMATIVYSVAESLGELATYIPITGSFAVFTTRYLSQSFGASMGWLYWFSWAITFAIELNTIGPVIEYWTDAVPTAGWIAIFFVILTTINFFPVGFYGEVEFWVASVKVIAIIGWLIYALCMTCGAGVTGPVGFRYWNHPGPMGDGIWTDGVPIVQNKPGRRFMGWLNSLVNAAFTYQGCELVGVTAGEAQNPRKSVPRAINRVFARICIFYIGAIFFMGMLVPFNDPKLTDDSSVIASSPFVIAILNSGTKILPHIFNAVILITLISAGNSNVYIGSRVVYALADSGTAPKFFKRTTKKGVPYIAVCFTSAFGLLSFMSVSESSSTVFDWFINISAVAGLICWAFISASHIRFMQVLKQRGIPRDSLPFKARWQPFYAWYALISIIFITLIQGFTSFWHFTAAKFMTAYISVIVWVGLYVIFQCLFRCKFLIPIEEVDIDSGRREIEDNVWEEKIPTKWYEKLWNIVA